MPLSGHATPNRDKFRLTMLSQDDRLARLLRAGMKVLIVSWRVPSRLFRAPTVSAMLWPLAWGSLLSMFSTGANRTNLNDSGGAP